jgi:hypothetical protein
MVNTMGSNGTYLMKKGHTVTKKSGGTREDAANLMK